MSAAEASLRVVVRARPMNARETREGARKCVEYYENSGQIIINDSATFTFDSVFPDTVDQETVYEKTALPLLDRIFAGFNATVLAYGQTGSGKTYTMGTEDNDGTDEMRRGIIPRLVHALFQRIMATEVPEAFKVTVSMYEVYGDNVFDLLRPDKVKLNVHGDEKNCTIVNLTAVPVIDLKGALKQLATGCHYRTKAETAMNAMSSRSHAVFTVFVEKTAAGDSDSSFSAKLQLVDLAGSERLKKTEAEGNRMKEGISINGGLLILSQVIAALATKQKHVPYRNSVITRVLQDSLGGNSFTVFLACISPADSNSAETLNTLRYADRAKQIKNKPIVNKNPKAEEIAVLRAQLKRLEKENADLRQGIAPTETKHSDVAASAEILSLKDLLARKEEELRERANKHKECIVRLNGLSQRYVRLEADNSKLSAMVTSVRSTLLNEEMLESTELVRSIQQVVGEADASTLADDEQDETAAMPSSDDTMYDSERLPELQAELDDLDKQIALKDENMQKDLENQREFIEMIQQREDEKTQLVVRVGELETEITKLRNESKKANTASKLAEERRQKLNELERQHAEHKKTLSELKKLQDTRRRMEESMKKTEDELRNMKMQRIRLLKEQRAEAKKFQASQQKHEREMAQIKSKLQKREMDVARQERSNQQKMAVLQQRLDESNRANKTLRELNQKRANRKGPPTNAPALQNLIEEEFEIETTALRCQLLCEELRRQRQELMQRINIIESQKFEGGKRVCRRWRTARRRGYYGDHSRQEDPADETLTKYCEHEECQTVDHLNESSYIDVTADRRMSSVDPDVSVVLEGEEEFEQDRQKELATLRTNLEILNEEIKDSLRNGTISTSEERANSRWEKVPVEMRPVVEAVYTQTVAHMKKEIELEFQLTKTKAEYTTKMAAKASLEDKRKREDEDMRARYSELAQNLEEAKSGLHEKITFLLCLVKSERIDEKFLQQFDSLKNQFCDVEHKIKKARRRTTNFAGGLTPKPELKRNERTRRAVAHYGHVVNSEDVTLDDSRRHNLKRRDTSRSATEIDKEAEENVRRRVAMSPIRFSDDTRISEEDEQENLCDATFVKETPDPSNATFVIHRPTIASTSEESGVGVPPLRRKSRRTECSLGPLS